ncbi:uncharacterized protein LOC122030923 [Zingiber officinale]|uniref:uncharacterized protein LOC122030923 n=1 Tax=Zingiber officinale TaxID=94328 RepID=UPI001C4B9C3D|nr:uncharacterized protein LOC122030923 [Zingiber officinale]
MGKRGALRVRRVTFERDDFEAGLPEKGAISAKERSGDADGCCGGRTVVIFGLWAVLMYYVIRIAPNQSLDKDWYYVQKLFFLKGDDGFVMNQVLIAAWYILGLLPLAYGLLLVPTGRSSRYKVLVWPLLIASFFGGSYALLLYFLIWKPPPPDVTEEELNSRSVKFADSKITAAITTVAGLGLYVYGGIADGAVWIELYQYFQESWLVHVAILDIFIHSFLGLFWVYNDMRERGWIHKGAWLLPFTLIPLVGPSFYALLRPPLSALPVFTSSTSTKND